MSASNDFENKLWLLLFNNTTLANIGDATGLVGSTGAGSTQLALSTGTLADTDTLLTSSEATYTGYARQTQARSSGGWTVSNNSASNAALIQFGNDTSGTNTIHSVGLGFLATGDNIRLWAILTADLVVNAGVNPQFAIGACAWTID